MEDADRANLPLILLTVLWLIIAFIITVPMGLSTLWIIDYPLFIGQMVLLFLFWALVLLTPRYRHYNRAFNEWAKTYQYKEEV